MNQTITLAFWTAATCRRFESADVSAQSKSRRLASTLAPPGRDAALGAHACGGELSSDCFKDLRRKWLNVQTTTQNLAKVKSSPGGEDTGEGELKRESNHFGLPFQGAEIFSRLFRGRCPRLLWLRPSASIGCARRRTRPLTPKYFRANLSRQSVFRRGTFL
jgi:hypothetical protein